MKNFLLLTTITFILFGCAHVISEEMRKGIDKEIKPAALFKDPYAYKEKTVLLGGIIVSSINKEGGTYIEVLQKPLDFLGRPEDTDISFGRFIIFYEGYLDTAIYSTGREITAAGDVMGKLIRPLGEIQYPYPLIKSKELHLLEPRRELPIRFSIGVFGTL